MNAKNSGLNNLRFFGFIEKNDTERDMVIETFIYYRKTIWRITPRNNCYVILPHVSQFLHYLAGKTSKQWLRKYRPFIIRFDLHISPKYILLWNAFTFLVHACQKLRQKEKISSKTTKKYCSYLNMINKFSRYNQFTRIWQIFFVASSHLLHSPGLRKSDNSSWTNFCVFFYITYSNSCTLHWNVTLKYFHSLI